MMNSVLLRRATTGCAFALAIVCAVVPQAIAQTLPDWYNTTDERGFPRHVSDFYQHQRLAANHPSNPPQPPPNQSDANWENDGGWCYIATYVNACYKLYREGSCTMFGATDPNLANANWLDLVNAYMENMEANLTGGPNGVQKWLDDHDDAAATPTCKRPLKYDLFVYFPDAIRPVGTIANPGAEGFYFLTATDWKKLKAGTTPYDKIEQALLENATVTIRIRTLPWGPLEVQSGKWVDPKFNSALWWAGNGGNANVIAMQTGYANKTFAPSPGAYHSIIVAGLDGLNRQIFISDPDTNKGNLIAHAGFRASTAIIDAVQNRKYHPWVAALGGGDAIPVPPRGPTADADPIFFTAYYMGLTLMADGRTFDPGVASNERYRNVVINWVETIAPPDVRKKFTPAPLTPSLEHRYDVLTGAHTATDEIWFLPSEDFAILPGTVVLTGAIAGWDAEFIGPPGSPVLDPYDNPVLQRGLRLSRGGGPPLFPGQLGELRFESQFAHEGDKYIVYSRNANNPTEYRVQAYGVLEPEQDLQIETDISAVACSNDRDGNGQVDKRDLILVMDNLGVTTTFDDLVETIHAIGPCR